MTQRIKVAAAEQDQLWREMFVANVSYMIGMLVFQDNTDKHETLPEEIRTVSGVNQLFYTNLNVMVNVYQLL